MDSGLTALRPATRPIDPATAALRAAGQVAFAALVAFHVWLFGLHLLDGRALQPATAARWGLGVLVLAGFRALSRRDIPLFRGRRAVVLWLLVVIIHCSAAWDGGAAALDRAIPETAAAAAQLACAAGVIGLVLLAALAQSGRPLAGRRPSFPVPALIAGLPSTGLALRFSSRPPPLS
jgi:hypothetical protein